MKHFSIQLLFWGLAVLCSCTNFKEEEAPVRFAVDMNELTFTSAASTNSIVVTSGTMWDVTGMPEWISLKSIKSSVQSPFEWIVDFNAVANEEYDREGLIIIISGSEAEEIVVTQEGKKGKHIAVESVSLSPTELNLTVGESATLAHTIRPEKASVKDVSWKSSAPSVATISQTGRVDAVAEGTALITVTTEDGGKTATCTVTVATVATVAIPEAIDLRLPSGLKWATFNLGASAPEEYGDYYAWGETEPYYSSQDPLIWKEGKEAGYSWASYKWCMGSYYMMTKYCTDSFYGYSSFTDTKTVLDLEDDAAHVNLGGSWRMPTDAEWRELGENCTCTWGTKNGVNGMLVTGSNGNSIFLPAAGYRHGANLYDVGSDGFYWSSSLDTDYPSRAWYVRFYSGSVYRYDYSRNYGPSVRPVSE